MYELIHALGYGKTSNFKKVNPRRFGNFGTSYDLNSVMHYHKNAFSADENTIVPLKYDVENAIGQRERLSPGDIQRINNMYKCF